jgi:hypothetical protein
MKNVSTYKEFINEDEFFNFKNHEDIIREKLVPKTFEKFEELMEEDSVFFNSIYHFMEEYLSDKEFYTIWDKGRKSIFDYIISQLD